jgi:integrase/recombinase XerD
VVIAANGRVKPDYAIIEGKSERHPEGPFYPEWYEGSKRGRRSVGKDTITATARRHQQEQILASKAAGIKLADEDKSDGTLLGDAIAAYLEEIRKTNKRKTYLAYKIALGYFLESCMKSRVADRKNQQRFFAVPSPTRQSSGSDQRQYVYFRSYPNAIILRIGTKKSSILQDLSFCYRFTPVIGLGYSLIIEGA